MSNKRKTVAERQAELRTKPVEYLKNGTVRYPVTYSQLISECESLKAQLERVKKDLDCGCGVSGCRNPKQLCANCRIELLTAERDLLWRAFGWLEGLAEDCADGATITVNSVDGTTAVCDRYQKLFEHCGLRELCLQQIRNSNLVESKK